MLSIEEASEVLSSGYPSASDLRRFPFASYLEKLWKTDKGYDEHGPKVIGAVNTLLSENPHELLGERATSAQVDRLRSTIDEILTEVFTDWPLEDVRAFFRIVALYHDIGKYIIKDRHPSVGWHVIQYLDPEQKRSLRNMLKEEEYFRLFAVVIRDHDQFGVLSTGEASYPILLTAMHSLGDSLEDRRRILSAMMLFNLADMAGVFKVDGETVDKIIDDWEWVIEAVSYCVKHRLRLSDFLISESSSIDKTGVRIQRLLAEASREWPRRRREVNDEQFIREELETVFGGIAARREFSARFTRVCKLDYGKRFFDALIEYAEGPPQSDSEKERRRLPLHAPERLSREDVLYAVLAILRRITTDSAWMFENRRGSGNLIGVEMKELTPPAAPEKTATIIDLLVRSHYPGLTWLMSDVPAWNF